MQGLLKADWIISLPYRCSAGITPFTDKQIPPANRIALNLMLLHFHREEIFGVYRKPTNVDVS